MRSLKLCVGALVFLTAATDADAQVPVGAGGQIQQFPARQLPENPVPSLPLPKPQAASHAVDSSTRFRVAVLHITGDSHFSEATLIKVAKFQPGKNLTLQDLTTFTQRVTNFLNQRGYFVARAYLPPQDITDGVVTIAVIEGQYGQIGLRNNTNVSNAVFLQILDGLTPGATIKSAPLERRLLIISDLPGVRVNAVLAPGQAVGTANLAVGVSQGPRFDGDVEAENWGNPYTGSYLLGGTINLNEPFGHGDVLSFRTLESTTGGATYNRLSYQTQIADATVGVALTGFRYRLGKQFRALNANGWEGIGSLYASYPLIRSYRANLYVTSDLDQRFFQDNIGATSVSVDRRATVLNVGLNGNSTDQFGGGGFNDYAVSVTLGDLSIETRGARLLDSSTARTNGVYTKLYASVSRLQEIAGPLSIFVGARGQLADKNLDISEKMELGGANGVRAYPEGEAYGDDGYIATIEPRLMLPMPPGVPGQLQLISFIDTGYVKIEHTPYSNATNGLSRTGAGFGVSWSDPNNFLLTATYAHILGANKATSYANNGSEIWFEAVKYF